MEINVAGEAPVETEEEKVGEFDEVSEELLTTAAVFGQSEAEIEREFKAYKAAKLYKRIDYDATHISSDEELNSIAEECLNYGFGGIVVLPQYISKARSALKGKGVEIIAAVSYPYGEEIPFTTVQSTKKAVSKGADCILVPVGLTLVKRGDYDTVRKQFKKLTKVAKKIKLRAVTECGTLTAEEVEKTVKVLSGAGVKAFQSSTGVRNDEDEFFCVKNLYSACKSENSVTAYASSHKGETAVRLLTVADTLVARRASAIAEEIKEKLNIE